MAKLLNNKAKLFLLIYGIIIAVLIIFSLFFMTSYANIHVMFAYNTNPITGAVTFSIPKDTTAAMNSTKITNVWLYRYFANTTEVYGSLKTGAAAFEEYKTVIYDFQNQINAFNQYLIISGIVSLALFACILIASNGSRRIFYKSNVIAGVIFPVVIVILSIVGMIMLFQVMGSFTANEDLFKVTSLMMATTTNQDVYDEAIKSAAYVATNTANVNVVTFIVCLILILILVGYSVFIMIYTVTKYNKDKKERDEIIERAQKEMEEQGRVAI